MTKLRKLVNLGSPARQSAPVDRGRLVAAFGERAGASLASLLEMKNGWYAFEGALHVLSEPGTVDEPGLIAWNRDDLWRQDYDGMADGAVFFAEDVFGTQFCLREGAVCTFDPETGAFEVMAPTLEAWASEILRDYGLWTGHKLAREWQRTHGPLPAGSRLVPITPFVTNGPFEVSNLHVLDAVKGMKLRGSLAVQIRDLPDGATIRFQVVE
jgi:hypothetical protein